MNDNTELVGQHYLYKDKITLGISVIQGHIPATPPSLALPQPPEWSYLVFFFYKGSLSLAPVNFMSRSLAERFVYVENFLVHKQQAQRPLPKGS